MGMPRLSLVLISSMLLLSGFGTVLGGATAPTEDDASVQIPASIAPPRASLPADFGPYNHSYVMFNITLSSHTENMTAKVYYPSDVYEENGTANTTGAPYPLVIMNPHYGGNFNGYQGEGWAMASWSYIFLVTSPFWNDATWLGVANHNEIIDFMAAQNATPGGLLQGMVSTDRVGLMGHSSGGGITAAVGPYVDRVKGVVPMAGAIGTGSIDMIKGDVHKPYLIQIGEFDDQYAPSSHYMYKEFNVEKEEVIVRDGGHGGPYRWDMSIAFFNVLLYQNTSYRECLFDNCAFDLMADGFVNLSFKTDDGKVWPPNASYSKVWPTQVTDDQTMNFTGWVDGIFIPDHPRVNFTWDFDGDGTIDWSDHANNMTTYSYNRSGTYKPVFGWAIGIWRLIPKDGITVSVTNVAPVAEAGPDVQITEDTEIMLNGSMSADTPSDLQEGLFYKWEYGDGASVDFVLNNSEVFHKYTAKGKFTVKLSVRDVDGAISSDTLTVNVSNVLPTVIAMDGVTGAMDSQVRLTGTGNDTNSDKPTLTYMWNFGDGESSAWSSGPAINHTYITSGDFVATLSIKDNDGSVGNDTTVVYISNPSPSINITLPGPGLSCEVGEEVFFDAIGNDTASDIPRLEYMWEFGDGNTSEWSSVGGSSHVFQRPGEHNVTANVRDSSGTVVSATISIMITNLAPMAYASTISQEGVPEGTFFEEEPFTLSGTGTDTPSDEGTLAYSWALVGGDEIEEVLTPISEGRNVTYSLPQKGTYQIRLTVSDDHRAQGTMDINVTIKNKPPVASGSLDRTEVMVNEEFNFTADATDTAADTVLGFDYEWDFGNGNVVYIKQGTQTYWEPGTYNVTLTVTDEDGDKDTLIFTITVKAPDGGGGGGGGGEDGGDEPSGLGTLGAVYIALIIGIIIATVIIVAMMFSKSKTVEEAEKEEKGQEEKEEEDVEEKEEEKEEGKEEEEDDDEDEKKADDDDEEEDDEGEDEEEED